MKKFLIVCTVVILTAMLGLTLSDYKGLSLRWFSREPVTAFTGVEGKTILLDTGKGMEPFEIRGVNMGVGIPGHFATDYAIDKETYLRWFAQIKELGANCVRVYTILQDDFYEAVWEYNKDNEDPLYVIHGLWVNDYIHNSHRDAYDPDYIGAMLEDSRTLVDIIHGNKVFSLSEDLGSGTYRRDISPWVIGYILGVEWEDTIVEYTNHMQKDRGSYQGKYLYTSPEATPFEAALAQVGDQLISYESNRYKTQRLLALSNWPTTDPLDWDPLVVYYFRKFAKVDVEHIKTTEEFLSGQFASYHAYPYYPDYYGFMDIMELEVPDKSGFVEDGVYHSYRAYLAALNEHHTMPVVIAEYGVPSSRGRAQTDRNTGRSQGGMSEQEQGQALVSCYQDIMAAGCSGSLVFTWQDEWFKRTWNTMAYTDLTKTPNWSDYQTNEQYFGLLSFDPGQEESVCYVDGDVSEWTQEDVVLESGDFSLSCKYDEKYLYFYIHTNKDSADRNGKEGDTPEKEVLYLPIDTTPKSGSRFMAGTEGEFGREADFVLILDGEENSRLLVQKRYEALRAMYSHLVYLEDAYLNEPARNTDEFVEIRLMLQTPEDPHGELATPQHDIAETFDTGKLTHGNGNPHSAEFNSLSDFYINGEDIEIRLPWSLLNFLNPSEMVIHDDYYEHYGIEGLEIGEIYAGVGRMGEKGKAIPMEAIPLKGWGQNPASHERLKRSYYILKDYWAEEDDVSSS